jgi:hypothetical protein
VIDVDYSGGAWAIAVSTGSGCTWTATSNESWIAVTSGTSGTGSGTVRITVARNDDKKRHGTLSVAGQSVKVNQDHDKGRGKP